MSQRRRFKPTQLANFILGVLGLLWVQAACAVDLAEAKAQGLIGERADGYVGLVQATVEKPVNELVETVNAKRQIEYQRIAAANNLTLAQVEALAGKKTLAKTEAGQWIYIESWRQK